MDKSTKELVKQMQNISYNILCDVNDFCTENNLTYMLSGGSCLGAIRNKGFIPWDDDADIMLPRGDYEELLQNFEQNYKGKYRLDCVSADNYWYKPYARIWDTNTELIYTKTREIKMGVFVDVFPIDGIPRNEVIRSLYFMTLRILNILRNAAIRTDFYDFEKHRCIKRILGLFARPFGGRFFAIQMNKVAKKYSFDKSRYVGVSLSAHYWEKETIKREYMSNTVQVPFESGEFPVPVGYDQYLKNLYGDYMKVPKNAEEKGYTHLDGWVVKIKNNKL